MLNTCGIVIALLAGFYVGKSYGDNKAVDRIIELKNKIYVLKLELDKKSRV